MKTTFTLMKLLTILIISSFFSISQLCLAQESEPLRLYTSRFDSAEHPDHTRLHVTPPDWSTFNGKTQFITLRYFPSKKGIGRDFEILIDQHQQAELGRFIWPTGETIFFKNLEELVDILKKRNLFLFALWGYVPGSGPRGAGDWTQFRPDPKRCQFLEDTLGPLWLGMDNGEQDGRYVGGFAEKLSAISQRDRFSQYLNFQHHFEGLGNDLGNRLSTLVSLNFGHYLLKEGIHALIGAESAQALPNSQVYYSWIRGAGKQYGVLWFGNVSVFNRWGWKIYPEGAKDASNSGPTKGTSLALMKRLLYSHILYNSAAVGFENGWFAGNELSPIGKIQQSAVHWLNRNGDPGTMITPVALLCDFYSGWSFPRHLYATGTYLVWGNIPYGAGDYLTNDLFDLIYPGYQESSYFKDETGFLTPTPYGDSADCLLSDAPLWLLRRYALVILANELSGTISGQDTTKVDVELADKLTDYVAEGGRLVITAGNLDALGDNKFGIRVTGGTQSFDAGAVVRFDDNSTLTEIQPFEILPLIYPAETKILCACDQVPLAIETRYKKGTVVVLASPFGLSSQRAVQGKIVNKIDTPLGNPFPLLGHVHRLFSRELNATVLFDVGKDLGSVVCRKEQNIYRIGLFNNTLTEKPFAIQSRIGTIASVRELEIDTSERTAVGFPPDGFENSDFGSNTDKTIAGGDLRIFEVTLDSERITVIPDTPKPARPRNRFLTLRGSGTIQQEILARPTFFEHYDGVMVDWRYFESRTTQAVKKEAGWLQRQKVKIIVDFSSGINLFPDLRMVRNDLPEYERSMATFKEVITKASQGGATEVLLKTHIQPENNYHPDQTRADTLDTLRELSHFAAALKMNTSLRVMIVNGRYAAQDYDGFYDQLAGWMKLAVLPELLPEHKRNDAKWIKDHVSFILASEMGYDEGNDRFWSSSIPLVEGKGESLRFINEHPELPLLFDAVYTDKGQEYRDVHAVEEELKRTRPGM
ncbi:MAG: hypothetical protein Q4G68_05960 [Planctomycetia bacterium]|nr:hypothetical protein [Planctomycetia bacterium]